MDQILRPFAFRIWPETYFYASSITETVLALEYCINPETNGASKTEYTSEESSEYHPQNINKYPDKKKFMEEFIKLAAQKHKAFEKEIKARDKHKIDFIYDWVAMSAADLDAL